MNKTFLFILALAAAGFLFLYQKHQLTYVRQFLTGFGQAPAGSPSPVGGTGSPAPSLLERFTGSGSASWKRQAVGDLSLEAPRRHRAAGL